MLTEKKLATPFYVYESPRKFVQVNANPQYSKTSLIKFFQSLSKHFPFILESSSLSVLLSLTIKKVGLLFVTIMICLKQKFLDILNDLSLSNIYYYVIRIILKSIMLYHFLIQSYQEMIPDPLLDKEVDHLVLEFE